MGPEPGLLVRLVSDVFGEPVAVRQVDRLAPWFVARVHLAASAADVLPFSNGDAGANNFFVDGSDGRIIDWECGGYRHALIDAASFYVPGPMWMTVANPTASGADDAYRTALASSVGAATDDNVFAQGMAGACIVMAIERLQRLPKLDARPAGHESRAQMVSTLDAAARAAEQFRSFPHLAGWARATAVTLRRRWPDSDHDFPDAYTTRE
ncbi:MAG: hypothetical protein WD271_13155 [Acidimicrobiia bacterium]